MQETPQGDDTRSYVSVFGLAIDGSYCFQAESHYQLGEPAAGITQATECASWLKRLIAYIEGPDANGTSAKLQALHDQLYAFRVELATHYPEVPIR